MAVLNRHRVGVVCRFRSIVCADKPSPESDGRRQIAAHRGRLVKLMGDGSLVEFASVIDAVQCAIDVQEALAGEASDIILRIGIHLGDVIIEGEDVYGTGVNIAARLEGCAYPGGICISSLVFESLSA